MSNHVDLDFENSTYVKPNGPGEDVVASPVTLLCLLGTESSGYSQKWEK